MIHRPDWRNPQNYPPVYCQSREYIAWEFLRRNSGYSLHFDQVAELPEEVYLRGPRRKSVCLDGFLCIPEALTGETLQQYRVRLAEHVPPIRGRVSSASRAFSSKWLLKKRVSPQSEFDQLESPFLGYSVGVKTTKTWAPERLDLPLLPNEMAIRFRLDLPIVTQLEQAKKRLTKAASELEQAISENVRSEFASLRLAREKNAKNPLVLEIGHYWLRCYDALNSASSLRTSITQPPREAELRQVFLSEMNEVKKAAMARLFTRGFAGSFEKSARAYIDKKYLLLLQFEGVTRTDGVAQATKNEVRRILNNLGAPIK